MSSSDTPKCILLRGDPLYGEATATAAITPGMLVTTAGGARTISNDPTVTPATADAVAPIFARENEVVGKGIDEPYAQDDNVLFIHARRGDWVYAWLASGESVTAGAQLSPSAGGYLEEADTGLVLARALETVNAAGEPARIKVEIV